ncbi:hypothetical protein N7492_010416 [Penicillium capsulatum]|uniref:Phytanoyl-CoA dioxygenase n=1 Tax=Penicillium capsulatum TaxID=69766 RepID=A0A9W9LDV6_9EURO|nr:hypothetical protein N7492_010416 [Penicillium capsulatum]KAJ6112920.1 hypothetical protein N7512_008244 [Penicillium capsulatum]
MSSDANYKLSAEQIEHFMKRGFVRIPDCFSREKAAEWTADVWSRLGFSPSDKTTWVTECTHMPEHKEEPWKSFAPKAWAAICELLGGEARVAEDSATVNDAFIVNLGTPETVGKKVEPEHLKGWHVDGDDFVHFLDSPEQALLVIPLFSDIQRYSGATAVCTDAMKDIARHLRNHPQGVSPYMVPRGRVQKYMFRRKFKPGFYEQVIGNCDEFYEMTGSVGDVILVHPLMAHSQGVNSLRLPRIITNASVSLKEPFNFNREDPSRYSIVERKTLQVLGKDGLPGWKIKGPREAFVPERVNIHARMKQEELKRLGGGN